MEALHTKPFLVEKLKKARDTGKITDCSLFHIPHADDIITRLQQMPMFKGLDVEDHRARFQGKGGNRNVHQDPWFYVFRAVVRISADGLSASRLDFHAGQRKSSGSMKSGERIAVLEIPHGEVGGSGGSAVTTAMVLVSVLANAVECRHCCRASCGQAAASTFHPPHPASLVMLACKHRLGCGVGIAGLQLLIYACHVLLLAQGYITSAQVTCKDTDPGSDIYNNIFHHNVPDDFDGVSLMFNIKARE
jgi:hypothetical protein